MQAPAEYTPGLRRPAASPFWIDVSWDLVLTAVLAFLAALLVAGGVTSPVLRPASSPC